jgi:hypothetical protein
MVTELPIGSPTSPDGDEELVDDRALESVDADRLRHGDLATELTDVISSVKAPASIALWGPWGSGKSGLAYLLETDLGKRLPKARFVRSDAFKFAETPLRRHFIAEPVLYPRRIPRAAPTSRPCGPARTAKATDVVVASAALTSGTARLGRSPTRRGKAPLSAAVGAAG